ncbi:MAG: tetratricopeptide repeat protein [Gammaproteobacteria bacterium]|nr:tetratricopeptide repeat protein [Gammaproteobacteria bacterium]MBU1654619.1 tetratricopeptide repeat protein [Gammaproteobacteria bacterium]MBU1959949.1 tetratricopeptide repeat protein [Gammaproteobacteria bacterium]
MPLRTAIAGLFVVAVVAGLFWNGLQGGFFFDDEVNILKVEGIKMTELSSTSVRDALTSGIAGPSGRPIAQLSFALNHYLSGFDPFAYKLTNLLIHLANGLLIYLIVRRLLEGRMIAGFVATIWLLHPIQITTVLYVVQRMTSLSTLFLLAGFHLHISGRERGGRLCVAWLALAWLICWPLSLMTKEIGALFPVLVLAWEMTLRHRKTGHLDRLAQILATAVGLVSAAILAYTLATDAQWLLGGYLARNFSFTERLLTEGRVLWLYLSLIAIPKLSAFGLHHDDIVLSTGPLSPWTTLPAWLGLMAMAWIAWRARLKAPLLSFGLAWFLIGHSLESTVLPLEIAHEHRNYLPFFGMAVIAGWALSRQMENSEWQRTLGIVAAIGMMVYFSFITALRAHEYGDELRRTQLEAEFHPGSARTQYEAGRALVDHIDITHSKMPAYYFARRHYERAGELDPNFTLHWLGLIQLNCSVKKPANDDWIDKLAERLQKIPLGPSDRNILFHAKEMGIAGTLCLSRTEVERLFSSTIANKQTSPSLEAILYSWLADYLALAAKDLPAAQSQLDKSLSIMPDNQSNLVKLAQLAFLQGNKSQARDILQRLNNKRLTGQEIATMELLLRCLNKDVSDNCVLK